MMLGFKRRFAPFVRDGSKRHTIRDREPPELGEPLHCYVDPRQKTMALLGRWPCVRVERIWIYGSGFPDSTGIQIDGMDLREDEREAFAWRDGFRCNEPFDEMLTYRRTSAASINFTGYLIHWDYDHPVTILGKRRKQYAIDGTSPVLTPESAGRQIVQNPKYRRIR